MSILEMFEKMGRKSEPFELDFSDKTNPENQIKPILNADIQLGDRCRDRISKFSGICIVRAVWLNGCIRITLSPETLKENGELPANVTFDMEQLELLCRGAICIRETATTSNDPYVPQPEWVRRGGPSIAPMRTQDPV